MALGKYKLALKDYERVYKVRPNDADAKKKFTECKKITTQMAFAKAIAVEENKGNLIKTCQRRTSRASAARSDYLCDLAALW